METYMILFRFTQKGIENIKDSPKRIETAKKMFQEKGITVKGCYLLLGKYDTMFLVEAPNADAVVGVNLKIGALGNVRSETLRAFPEKDYLDILDKV